MPHYIITILLLVLCLCFGPFVALAEIKDVDSAKIASLLEESKNAYTVIDMRTPSEYHSAHIQGAMLIDIMAPSFKEKLRDLPKDATYIVYCRTDKRSTKGVSIMKDLGFENIIHMRGGILDWQKQGLPVRMGKDE